MKQKLKNYKTQILSTIPTKLVLQKRLLYAQLDDLKHKYHCAYVLDGMIMDDLADYRPGLQARDDFSFAVSTRS